MAGTNLLVKITSVGTLLLEMSFKIDILSDRPVPTVLKLSLTFCSITMPQPAQSIAESVVFCLVRLEENLRPEIYISGYTSAQHN